MIHINRELRLISSFFTRMLGSKERVVILHIFYLVLCTAYSRCAVSSTHEHGFYLGERDGKSAQNVTWTFEGNLHKFKKSGVVEEFMKFHKNGLLAKDKVFNMRDPAIRAETISIIDLLFFSNDSDTMHTLVRWLYPQMNYEQFTYAQAVAKVHRQDEHAGNSFLLPHWYNIFPNYFIPNFVLFQVKNLVRLGFYLPDYPIVVAPEDSEGPASYFSRDVGLNNMFYNWNIYFPDWMDPQKYNCSIWKRRGELFFDFHQQIYAHHNMRAVVNNGLWKFDFENNILDGYSTRLRNSVGQLVSKRAPNATSEDSPQRREAIRIEDLMFEIIGNSTIHLNSTYTMKIEDNDEEMVSTLANLFYNTSESLNPSLYQSFYSAAVEYLASVGSNKDGGGIVKYPMSALSDPAFYPMLLNINKAMAKYRYHNMKYYDPKFFDADFKFESLSSDRLETFFEPFDIDISRVVDGSSGKCIVRQLRLNHKPFTIKMNITNMHAKQRNAMVSTFLTLDIYDDKYRFYGNEAIYQVLYRFPVKLEPGTNLFERKFESSPVYVDEDENMVQCGIPRRLVLPKGTEDGLKTILVAVVTPTVKLFKEPTEPNPIRSPLCGGTAYNYDLPLGFPFDLNPRGEKMNVKLLALYNATIYHTPRTYGPDITM